MSDVKIGDKVRLLVDCDNDLRDAGMGVERCADRGEIVIVRGFSQHTKGAIKVSHGNVTDSHFQVYEGEYEVTP